MRRIFFKMLILSLVFYTVSCDRVTETSTLLFYTGNPRLSSETRIFDNANLIQNKKKLYDRLKTLYTLADIDMVVVTVTDLQGNDIDDIANRLLTNWKIGENTNGYKGVLFLISVKDKLVRFKIGSDLKWIYPESFVESIEREQMVQFFESGRTQTGIAETLEMVFARANEEIKDGLSHEPGHI